MKQILNKENERGSAIVIALLVLVLLMFFVALAVSRTTNETIATANDAAETRSFTAAEASLENMTQQFDSIFDYQLAPTTADLENIRNSQPQGFDYYNFTNEVTQTQERQQVVVPSGELEGLTSTRDAWRLKTTAKDTTTGIEVELNRWFYNDRVPIFQFGIFYEDDLEFHPGPRFDFGGRVHANGNIFMAAGTGLYFSSRVTARHQVITDVGRNGRDAKTQWGDNVFIKDGAGVYQQLGSEQGSALNSGGTGPNLFADKPDMPSASHNESWQDTVDRMDGNLKSEQKQLQLPLKLAGQTNDYNELIKRGKIIGDLYNDLAGTAADPSIVAVATANQDNAIVATSRYANKTGIRVSLADSKAKLPGCAAAAATERCGTRLDGDKTGLGDKEREADDDSRGYQPVNLRNGSKSTRINGERFVARELDGDIIAGRGNWIKIEMVSLDPDTNYPSAVDITEDILSLGVTERAPEFCANGCANPAVDFKFSFPSDAFSYSLNNTDSRSIVKLQRFTIPGVRIERQGASNAPCLSDKTWNGTLHNFVMTNEASGNAEDNCFADHDAHKKLATVDGVANRKVVPFPIKMFDTREGLYNDNIDTNATAYNKKLPRNGVMSVIEIDVANMRRFLNGEFDGVMPTTTKYAADRSGQPLRGQDVPESNGWVLYVSDRRGDRDFDGEYDMEDIYGNNDGLLQPGENVGGRNGLDTDYKTAINENGEAPRYSESDDADRAAVVDHSYYRRAVRLVRGETIPGIYDPDDPNVQGDSVDIRGFSVASENAVYVQGNYNATGISAVGTPTLSTQFNPQNTTLHIPASVVGDAVMILSNSWQDSKSFRYPWTLNDRRATETTVRFALIGGDAMSSYENSPNQGGGDPRLAGGVHNFKRFLENWGGARLNYTGSLINLYNSRNNNGAFKCCNKIYSPPNRNWSFDVSFLDPERLPPGTPFIQKIQLTGFQRVNY